MQKEKLVLYAYLAGMIDADGWVTMERRKATRTPLIGVSVSDKKIPRWVKEHFGGKIISHPARDKKWKPMFTWTIKGRRAVEILKAIKPYMIHQLKRKRATLITTKYEEIAGCGEEKQFLREKRQELIDKVMGIKMRGA